MPFFGKKKEEKPVAAPEASVDYAPPISEPKPAPPPADDMFGGGMQTVTRSRRKTVKGKKSDAPVEDDASDTKSVASTNKTEPTPAPAAAEPEPSPEPAPEPEEEKPFSAPKLSFGGDTFQDFEVEDPQTAAIRRRLERFYEEYNPSKLSNIDATLKAYKGKEDQLFEALQKKYGPEPADKKVPGARDTSVAKEGSSAAGDKDAAAAGNGFGSSEGFGGATSATGEGSAWGDAKTNDSGWGSGDQAASGGGGWGETTTTGFGGEGASGFGGEGASGFGGGFGDATEGDTGGFSTGFGDAPAGESTGFGGGGFGDDVANGTGGGGFGDTSEGFGGDSNGQTQGVGDGNGFGTGGFQASTEDVTATSGNGFSTTEGTSGFGDAGFGATSDSPVDAFGGATNDAPAAESSSDSDEEELPLYEQQQKELRSATSYVAMKREDVAAVVNSLTESISERLQLVGAREQAESQMEDAIATEDFEKAEELDEGIKKISQQLRDLDSSCEDAPEKLRAEQQELEAALKDLASLSEQHGISLKGSIADEERRVDRYITEATHRLAQVAEKVAADLERSTRSMNNIEQEVVNLEQRQAKITDRINSETAGLRSQRDNLAEEKQTIEDEIREIEQTLAQKRRALAERKMELGDVEEKLRIIMADHEETVADVQTQMKDETARLETARAAVEALTQDEEKAMRDKQDLAAESERLLKQLEIQRGRIASSAGIAAQIREVGVENVRSFYSVVLDAALRKRAGGKAFLCSGGGEDADASDNVLPELSRVNAEIAGLEKELQEEVSQQSEGALRVQEIGKSIPLLENAKKAAAAAKQFREAGAKTAEIKALTDEKTGIEENINTSQQKCKDLEAKLASLREQKVVEEKNAAEVISRYTAEYTEVLQHAASRAQEGSHVGQWIALVNEADGDSTSAADEADPMVEAALRLVSTLRRECHAASPPGSPSQKSAPSFNDLTVADAEPAAAAAPELSEEEKEEIRAKIASLEEQIEQAAESEDYEQAEALQMEVDSLTSRLNA